MIVWMLAASAWAGPRLIDDGKSVRWMTERQVAALARANHERGAGCPGFIDVTGAPAVEPQAPISIALFEAPKHQALVRPLVAQVSADRVRAVVDELSAFNNRYYTSRTGVEAAHAIADEFRARAGGRSDVSVTLFEHTGFSQPSVIARIQGSGPHADETVVIGGHEDSINWEDGPGDDDRAPGADDDASGVATVLEVFRVLAESGYRPARSIELMTYAGEERGLLGSQQIARKYATDGRKVVAAIQYDMTMFPGGGDRITFISDHVDDALTTYLSTLVDEYVHVPWDRGQCGYACSDHASWTRSGYPSAFPFEAPFEKYNHDIHSTRDLIALLDAAHGAHFAELGVAAAVELTAP